MRRFCHFHCLFSCDGSHLSELLHFDTLQYIVICTVGSLIPSEVKADDSGPQNRRAGICAMIVCKYMRDPPLDLLRIFFRKGKTERQGYSYEQKKSCCFFGT